MIDAKQRVSAEPFMDPGSGTILVVDDDEDILEILQRSLEAEGYRAVVSGSGEDALDRLRAEPPDLLILDVMLPGIGGFELCRKIRRFSDLPIVLLTAKSDTVDIVVGLESGADDYIVKPFEMRVLVARVRSLLRRIHGQEGESARLRVGPLEIRPNEGIALKEGRPLPLTRTEFMILAELASAPRRVFTREILLDKVWGYDYFGDSRLVDVHVRRLRGKVEDDPANPKWIKTVRGMGYRLSEED